LDENKKLVCLLIAKQLEKSVLHLSADLIEENFFGFFGAV